MVPPTPNGQILGSPASEAGAAFAACFPNIPSTVIPGLGISLKNSWSWLLQEVKTVVERQLPLKSAIISRRHEHPSIHDTVNKSRN